MDNPICGYCENVLWHSAKWSRECLPDDIPSSWFGDDDVAYHPSCWDIVIHEARQEIAMKHYEPSVSPQDCAIGGEEDSNWT